METVNVPQVPRNTREALVGMMVELGHMRGDIGQLQIEIACLRANSVEEASKCPFYPSRSNNGNKTLDRLTKLETLVAQVRSIGLIFVGIGGITGIYSLTQLLGKIRIP